MPQCIHILPFQDPLTKPVLNNYLENQNCTNINIVFFADCHHFAHQLAKKIVVVQVFAQELQVLQYTNQNDTKTVFPRPDQIDPYGCQGGIESDAKVDKIYLLNLV